jgi:hypothetical protein
MKENGTLKLIGIFLAVITLVTGLLVGGYTWTSNNFVAKAEISYIREAILDIRTDVKEIKGDLKEMSRVVFAR